MSFLKIRDLVEEIKDGIEIQFEVDNNAAKTLLSIISGNGGTFPIKVKIKIEEDEKKIK